MDAARSDATLLARSRSRPEVFGVLFDRHLATIHRYLERRIGADSADQLAGEVFRVAFERRDRFVPLHESTLPWLYGVATNLMLKRWRDERRRLRALARLEATAEHESQSLDGLEERLDAHSVRAQLLDGLVSLRLGDRDVLVLVAWEELSCEEVAAALDIPIGTVPSVSTTARRSGSDPGAPSWDHTVPAGSATISHARRSWPSRGGAESFGRTTWAEFLGCASPRP